MNGLFMVFDVESVGLHGEGFAVGWVTVDRRGDEVAAGCHQCPPQLASGDLIGHEWVKNNWAGTPGVGMLQDPPAVRRAFWADWCRWKKDGAVLVADCGWPVEARFLAACVDDNRSAMCWEGPYPLHELASFLVAAGMDPLAKRDRLPRELPEHDPLADARQSARLLARSLDKIHRGRT